MNNPKENKESYAETIADVGEGVAEVGLEGIFDVVVESVGDVAGEIIGGIADGIS